MTRGWGLAAVLLFATSLAAATVDSDAMAAAPARLALPPGLPPAAYQVEPNLPVPSGWQLPDSFRRDDDRLAYALGNLPPGRHAFELRHPSWFAEPVWSLLREHGAAFVLHDDRRRRPTPEVLTTDWTYLRFHYGRRGHRGNYSERELREWAARVRGMTESAEVFAYFNNDWEVFAPRNAERLRTLVAGG